MSAKPNAALCEIAQPTAVLAGFTIVELAAILALLTILACVVGRAMSSSRTGSAAFLCQSNSRQIACAWQLYTDDNDGRLVRNYDGVDAGQVAYHDSWVAGWMDFSQTNPDNTNSAMLLNHMLYPHGAYLGKYVKSAAAFQCPDDPLVLTYGGQQLHRARSFSMNNCFNGRMWTTPSRYTLYANLSQMKRPAGLFVFLDEHSQTINDGCFFGDPDTRFWIVDFPGSVHNRSGSFGFADCHTELHRWKDERTSPPVSSSYPLGINFSSPGNVDIDWLQQHTSELK